MDFTDDIARSSRPAALVVGGTGYLGRFVCAGLAEAGYEVTAVARRAAALPPGCHLYLADLAAATTADLGRFLDLVRPRVVVNAAGALWRVTGHDMARSNRELVTRLVAVITAGREHIRLVHLGSVYEYGAQPAGCRVLTEDTPEHPVTPYARSKLAGTRIVTDAVAARRLDGVVLRLSATIGPHAPAESLFGGLAGRLARRPETLEVPELSGERDFLDVRDAACAVVKAVKISATPPVLNVARGRPSSVAGLVDRLIRISGVPVRTVTVPRPAGRRDADAGPQLVDVSAARRTLRWIPQHRPGESLHALWRTASDTPALHRRAASG
ncbi:NAD-dependent epimerase/dehydratase family protein [Streptosporangium sandarakinum]|uniref:NAD-dependent epimerase/dehydratase family protein n=1 Tax=Streptosporangium sandarakinum TaxID=1260955 RepID=UPI003D8DB90E